MELNQLLEKLDGVKKTNGGHMARCPAHEDSTASLCVAVGDSGKLLAKCQAGCTPEAVMASMGLKISDLFPKAPKDARKAKSRIVATYDYCDEKGKLLFQVCRMEPKDFRQRQPDATAIDGWNWKTAGVRRVLFRLPELLAAIQKSEPLFIVEGEKDVLALVEKGFVATCNAGGANKWNESYTASLKNADVVVIPDKDEPGKKHAALICSKLRGVARSIKVLELPDVGGKTVKDAHDFFAHGGTADLFRELANKSTVAESISAIITGQPQKPAEIPEFHYDTEKASYWRRNPAGFYVRCSETDLKRHMRLADVDVDSHTQNRMTRFDLAICKVQNEAGVDAVIALAGHKAGIFSTQDGRRILIPRSTKLIAPLRGLFPNLTTLHEELFGVEQLPYVLGWLKCAVEDMYSLNPQSWRHSQLLALVGKADCGKSFYQSLITKMLGGREADPYLSIIGKSSFNEDLAEAEHLKMEDKNAHRDIKSRTAFGSSIKQFTVSKDMPCHGKGKKAILLPTYRRLSISINDDAEYITVLPMLDDSVRDKLLIIHCCKAIMLPDWKANMERFEKELPAFLHFLLNSHTILDELKDVRFGIKSFLAPHVVELLEQFEPHLRLLEIIDGTLFGPGNKSDLAPWKGTSSELSSQLTGGPHATTARQLLSYSSAAGQLLAKLIKLHPERFIPTISKGTKKYTILAPK